jgi:hypothetical protein
MDWPADKIERRKVDVRRWQDFTGQQAKLEESGETFSPLLANAS